MLLVIITLGMCFLAWWAVALWALGLLLLLWFAPIKRSYKIVTLSVITLNILSFALTTDLVPHPTYRTYDPDAGLRGVIIRYVNWYLGKFMKASNANILTAMLFGDKSGLSATLRADFSVAGIAHLLAVSGMHVALVAGVLGVFLQLCRVPARAHLFVTAPCLLLYAYLCGWQYSVLRALIMYLVYSVGRRYFRRLDSLSTLSLSAVLILLLFPYAIVSISFWLSFSCVFGIILFYQIFAEYCWRSVAMYLAVTLGSFPFVVNFFGELPLFGVVANVVLLPLLVAVFYCGLFAVSTFLFGAVLWFADPILDFVRWVCYTINQLPWAMLTIGHSWLVGPAITLYLSGLWLVSRFVNLPSKIKYGVAVALFTCYFVLLMV